MDKVLIKNLRVRTILGIHDQEREKPQEILINVVLFTDTQRAGQTDDISECVDYGQITRGICALIEKAQRFTVEALADDIANLCLGNFRVRKVAVRVEKPGRVAGTEAVGVEIERGEI